MRKRMTDDDVSDINQVITSSLTYHALLVALVRERRSVGL